MPAFLEGKIPFPAIWETVEAVMQRHATVSHPHLEEILRADAWARADAGEEVKRRGRQG